MGSKQIRVFSHKSELSKWLWVIVLIQTCWKWSWWLRGVNGKIEMKLALGEDKKQLPQCMNLLLGYGRSIMKYKSIPVDTSFYTRYILSPHSPMTTSLWFRAQSRKILTWEVIFGKIKLTFRMEKMQETLSVHVHILRVCIHIPRVCTHI